MVPNQDGSGVFVLLAGGFVPKVSRYTPVHLTISSVGCVRFVLIFTLGRVLNLLVFLPLFLYSLHFFQVESFPCTELEDICSKRIFVM
ncbi:MAG: hypothetical protein CSA33_01130 [Desulfobulbus propionicus]|nr:MAG: hypothetical protein CSA33_01130 [Desulfobulbus propionicus]